MPSPSKEPFAYSTLRRNMLLESDPVQKQINLKSNKIIIDCLNPITPLSPSGPYVPNILPNNLPYKADLWFDNSNNVLYGYDINNKCPKTDLIYATGPTAAPFYRYGITGIGGTIPPIYTSGSEPNIVNSTGFTISLPNQSYSQWLFNCPSGYNQQFSTIKIDLGSYWSSGTADVDSLSFFEFWASTDSYSWVRLFNLGNIPSTCPNPVVIDLSNYNLVEYPNFQYLRFVNIGLDSINVFKISNLSYCSSPVNSFWQPLIDLNNISWFNTWTIPNLGFINTNNITFSTYNNLNLTNDGNPGNNTLFPYDGYYEITAFIAVSDWKTVLSPHDTEVSNIYSDVLSLRQTSPDSYNIVDISGNINSLSTGVLWFKNSMQGTKIVHVTSGSGRNMGIDLYFAGNTLVTWILVSGGYINAKFIGTTLNN